MFIFQDRLIVSISLEKSLVVLALQVLFHLLLLALFHAVPETKSPFLKVHFRNYQSHMEPSRMKLIFYKSTCEMEALKPFPWSSSTRAKRQGTSNFFFLLQIKREYHFVF